MLNTACKIVPRRELAGRIRRTIERSLPRSAKFGLPVVSAVAVLGLILVPMAERTRGEQQPRKSKPAAAAIAPATPASETTDKPKPVLTGRIVDDRGEPVTDAEITLFGPGGVGSIRCRTDEQGTYSVSDVPQAGEYQLRVLSLRCVSLLRGNEWPRVHLAPGAEATKNISLKRGCRVRIQTVDEQGQPIAGVRLYCGSTLAESGQSADSVSTDRQGFALIGGLPATETEYLFGASHKDYGFEKLVATLDDPEAIEFHRMTLPAGKAVAGTAVCADGHPPAGWRITALPTWWNFGAWPMGEVIGDDGSFTLKHIVPGTYNVSVSIPTGLQSASMRTVLSAANLWDLADSLSVKLDYPSPASLASLEFKVQFAGGRLQRGMWVFADSTDGKYHGSAHVQPADERVVIGPIPKGVYRVRFESVEIEPLALNSVTVPSKELEVKLQVIGRPALRGRVVTAESGEPISAFRVRLEKKRALRGPNYHEDANWRDFNSAQGRFEVLMNGPGVYVIHVAADGLAPASSDELSTDTDKGREIVLKLAQPGSSADTTRSIAGTVVDARNRPVDGAVVASLAKSRGLAVADPSANPASDGVVRTEKGAFRLDGLKPGKDYLKVTHPEFAPALVEIDVAASRADERPVAVVLQTGNTVRGRVYDSQGRPEPGVALYVQDRFPLSRNRGTEPARLAAATTDANGAYEFAHLPDNECVIARVREWETQGVVRQAVRPRNNQTITLDFGGTTAVTGRIFVNGAPLGGAPLAVSVDSPHADVFRASGRTESDGSFVFYGIPPGRRTLYFYPGIQRHPPIRVGIFSILPAGADLGQLDVHTGRVAVRLVKPANLVTEDARVSLVEFNPIRLHTHGNVGIVTPPAAADDPFTIQHVPAGKYELVCWYRSTACRVQEIEITPERLEPSASITLPLGSAAVTARVDPARANLAELPPLCIRSSDSRFLAYATAKADGSFEFKDLAPGEYFFTSQSMRDPAKLAQFTLSSNEAREFDLTEAVLRELADPPAFLSLYACTPAGVILTGCDTKLVGQGQTLLPSSAQYGRTTFVGPAGQYELTASLPGFETHRQMVTLEPPKKDRPVFSDSALYITLRPAP